MTNGFVQGLFGNVYADAAIAAAFAPAAFTARMLAFETAWTRALAAEGVVAAADETAALAAIAGFAATDFTAGSAVDGVPVPALVKAMRDGLPAGAARAIHTGATSQDVIDSAMALTLLAVHADLTARLDAMIAAVAAAIDRFGDRPLMARTRMQAALPATVSLRLGAWHRALTGQAARAVAARSEIARVQVGGAIGTGREPDGKGAAIAARVAAELGLDAAPVWQTDRSGPVAYGHWLVLLTGTLGKIGQDIALMAQQGLDEIALEGGGGSSAMPHKRNPIAAEAMVTLARHAAAQQGLLAQAMVHEQERSGTAWALEWLTLPVMAEAAGASLTHGQSLLAAITRIGD